MRSQQFTSNDKWLDQYFTKFVQGKLLGSELDQWKIYLSKNASVREDFCEWLKTLRRSPWHLKISNGKDH